MKLLAEPSRFIPFLGIIALIAVGIHTSFECTSRDPAGSAIKWMIVYVSPLLLVALAVAVGKIKSAALFSAYFAISVGGYIEYGYYLSGGPSQILILVISLVAYWISGFIALFSFDESKP
ncbi:MULTISPECIES: hypothetical protein [Methylomonas]|uniref:Membrane protein DUF2069 n=1 Tax=Methylomonas defluvii TaxID=3045149 RepID=A0ABU4UIG0_9GAMM|nr:MULTISPECIES: hypothetical protein [unclassified Methylomonas]MDX8128504.1 hypothetical protein [Methylomonas sp. OY6]NOV28249.1 hypothetical protein [Methylomonas sp. ZR1]